MGFLVLSLSCPTMTAIAGENDKSNLARTQTPYAITTTTDRDMARNNPKDVSDALTYQTKLHSDINGNDRRYNRVIIRGIAEKGSMYVDGLPLAIGGSYNNVIPTPYGSSQIDVITGSGQTLFGSTNGAGLINMVTKKPQEAFHLKSHISLGSFDHKQIGVDAGGSLDDSGSFKARFTGLYQDSSTQNSGNDNDRLYIAPALTWQASDAIDWTILANFQRHNRPRPALTPYDYAVGTHAGQADRSHYTGDLNFDELKTDSAALTSLLNIKLSPQLSLHQAMRYQWIKSDWHYAYGSNPSTMTPSQASLRSFSVEGTSHQFAVDTKLKHQFEKGHIRNQFVSGLDFNYQHNREKLGHSAGLHTPGTTPQTPTYMDWTVDRHNLGLYAQNQLTFHNISVNLGGRFDLINTDITSRLNRANRYVQDSLDSAVSGHIGVSYQTDFGLTPFVEYNSAVSPWTISTGYIEQERVTPAHSRQYEAGIIYRPTFLDGRISFSVFDLKKDNHQVTTPSNNVISNRQGQIHIQGLDIETDLNLTPHLNFKGSASFMDPEITKTTNSDDLGKMPKSVPTRLVSAWLNYHTDRFEIGSGIRHVGASYAEDQNIREVKAYTLVDASASYHINQNWSLSLSAKNLFDTEYYPACYTHNCKNGERLNVIGSLSFSW